MKSGKRSNAILIAVFAVGLCLLLYPTVSDWWNSLHQSRAIKLYEEAVQAMDADAYAAVWDQAEAYNERLAQTGIQWTPTEQDLAEYNTMLAVDDDGIMGYIEIPSIDVYLAVYHGTGDAALQTGAGHLAGSSLPVGGPNTHAVISGHRGLPSARLFTDLNRLQEGDLFMLHVLNETLTYQVDRVLVVEPTDLTPLAIADGEDLCTLVTCTPYGINTQRLLVTGHRVENQASVASVPADAVRIEPAVVAPVVAAPLLLALLVATLVRTRKKG